MSNLKYRVERRYSSGGQTAILASAEVVAYIEFNFPEVPTTPVYWPKGCLAERMLLSSEQFLLISLIGQEVPGNAPILFPNSARLSGW
jgi:hypothetical protein